MANTTDCDAPTTDVERKVTRDDLASFFANADGVVDIFNRRLCQIGLAGPLNNEQKVHWLFAVQHLAEFKRIVHAEAQRQGHATVPSQRT